MDDLQDTLQSILSDPEQMARIASLAESLGLKPPDNGAGIGGGGVVDRPSEIQGNDMRDAGNIPQIDLDLAGLMASLSSVNGTEGRVLSALRPVLSRSGQGRVDRALRAAKLSRLAASLMKKGRAERV